MATENPTPEIWLPVVGYEGIYEVSNLGRIKSLGRMCHQPPRNSYFKREKILRPLNGHRGYLTVQLFNGSGMRCFSIHRLVLCAFIRYPLPGEEANHLDFDKSNNRLENLEWTTRLGNMRHFFESGRPRVRRK